MQTSTDTLFKTKENSFDIVTDNIFTEHTNSLQNSGKKNNYLYNNYIDNFKLTPQGNNTCYIQVKKDDAKENNSQQVFVNSVKVVNSVNFFDLKERVNSKVSDFFIVPFVITFIFYVLLIKRYWKYLGKFFEGFVYTYVVEKILSDINIPTRRMLFILDLLAIFTLSFVGYSAYSIFFSTSTLGLNQLLIFGLLFAFFLGYRIYAFLMHKIISLSLFDTNFINLVFFNSLMSIRIAGIVLFPFSFVLYYVNQSYATILIYILAGALGILIFYRFVRLCLLFIKNSISLLYFILYLCALEIVPALILFKMVQKM